MEKPSTTISRALDKIVCKSDFSSASRIFDTEEDMNFDQNQAEMAPDANLGENGNIADNDVHFAGIWEDWYWDDVMQEIDDVPQGNLIFMK